LTLGGGLGWLRRKYGLSCDNLPSADVVTADGRFLTASATENAVLFWAIRGGGGNFGIVTAFEFRLHPVGPIVMASATMYPAEQGRDVLRYFRDVMATAPEELSAEAFFWFVPPAPGLPSAAHNKHVVVLAGMYCGPADDGERVTEPLRKFASPVADQSGKIPFAMHQSGFDGFFPKAIQRYYMKSVYLRALNDAAVDTIIAHAVGQPDPNAYPIVWHLGGAMNRVPPEATAFGRRDAPFMIEITSRWSDPLASEQHIAWTRRFCANMEPYTTGKLYVNMPGFGEEEARFAPAAYGTNYERLVALKKLYDPTNLFRHNQNIQPTV
jgi:FAD/FMN-containing dehydrogenase